ncbi:zinc transporter 6-like [Xenia sp. Carnegie-2017]|uniref:zinc transporter 6-like n=1 Tax=Xenia sp. Carnegie-2017 TaxID=2897299 RepID=UPI001F0415F7|nr:zinc transporter 6-like [Xenia sp. Carnegie-2017]
MKTVDHSNKDSFVVQMPSYLNSDGVQMFRQRVQVDIADGKNSHASKGQHNLLSAIQPFKKNSSKLNKAINEFLKSVLSEKQSWRIIYLGCLNIICTIILFSYCKSSNSMALTAFTYITVFDFLSLFTCILSIWISLQKPSSKFTFGYARVQVLAVFASTILAVFGGLFVIKESMERLLIPPEVTTHHVVLVTCFGLLVHLIVTYGTKNEPFEQVLKASTSNWLQDALMDLGHSICGVFPPLGNFLIAKINPLALVAIVGAIAVIFTTVVIDFNKYYLSDTLAAVTIALITWGTMLPLVICSGRVLLQTCPQITMSQVDKCMREALTLDGVLEFRNEHFWSLSFGKLVGSLHVRVRRDADEQLVLAHVTNKLAAYVTDLTVQVFKEDWSRTGGSMNSVLMRPQWSLNPLDHTPRVLSHGIAPAS